MVGKYAPKGSNKTKQNGRDISPTSGRPHKHNLPLRPMAIRHLNTFLRKPSAVPANPKTNSFRIDTTFGSAKRTSYRGHLLKCTSVEIFQWQGQWRTAYKAHMLKGSTSPIIFYCI